MRSIDPMTSVQEVFFYVHVGDVQRAEAFYVTALGATVEFASPTWTSLVIAGVRVNLVLRDHEGPSVGMHFLVDDVALACAAVACAGGVIMPAVETRGGVLAEILDTEGNTLTLRQRRKHTHAETAQAA